MGYLNRRYEQAGSKEWNNFPLYSERYGKWYQDIHEVYEWNEQHVQESQPELAELKEEWDKAKLTAEGICDFDCLYLSIPEYLPTLDFSEDIQLPDNVDDLSEILPANISAMLNQLNTLIIETKFVVSYSETKFKPIPDTLGFTAK
ncbi:hypothetical protein [Pseudanabaena sp. 'Roaring Creek']|uniref:hypothetical protein n=1 Tax=Pseudanabaena sp. 'Roaring Creek' TaxID=1681830 RepID=UPI0006D79676|nr:hypothetical protein [Pseudanabaena sp. 'Roaring Creek']